MTINQSEMFEDEIPLPIINYVSFDDFQQALAEFYDAALVIREEIKREDLIAAYDRAKQVR